MTESNLVILTKWENKNNLNPSEQIVLCNEHYKTKKETLSDYEVRKVNSSIPEVWCEVCTPPDFGGYN